MSRQNNIETEIKLRLDSTLQHARDSLDKLGFHLAGERAFESNWLFDTPDRSLRRQQQLIRLRSFRSKHLLTFKGPATPGKHKSREELETEIADGGQFEAILARLGYERVFQYDKYRSEFERAGETGAVTLDETPIGNFIEIEGPPDWIDRVAGELGYAPIPVRHRQLWDALFGMVRGPRHAARQHGIP